MINVRGHLMSWHNVKGPESLIITGQPPGRSKPPLLGQEERLFDGVVAAIDGPVERRSGLPGAVEPREQLAADGVEEVIGIQVERVHQGQRSGRSVDLGDRDSPVQGDDGAGVEGAQQVVERDDLRPVRVPGRRGVTVDRIDGGLNLIRPGFGRCPAPRRSTRHPTANDPDRPAAPGHPTSCCGRPVGTH